jgi:hypothetical protein
MRRSFGGGPQSGAALKRVNTVFVFKDLEKQSISKEINNAEHK